MEERKWGTKTQKKEKWHATEATKYQKLDFVFSKRPAYGQFMQKRTAELLESFCTLFKAVHSGDSFNGDVHTYIHTQIYTFRNIFLPNVDRIT